MLRCQYNCLADRSTATFSLTQKLFPCGEVRGDDEKDHGYVESARRWEQKFEVVSCRGMIHSGSENGGDHANSSVAVRRSACFSSCLDADSCHLKGTTGRRQRILSEPNLSDPKVHAVAQGRP
jgi:hypothetical protein